jgi:hypothetical protein
MTTMALVFIGGSALPFLRRSALPAPPPPCFTQQMAEEIQEGMTEAEVVAVLGKPPGWDASPDTGYIGSGPMGYWLFPEGWQLPDGDIAKGWISDAGAVCVQFGKDGRVVWSHWMEVFHPDVDSREGLLRRMMRWMERALPW